jgi:hypothetical protein
MKAFFANRTQRGFNRNVLMRTMFLSFICLFGSKAALADTLKTKNFIVHITRNCPEGEVVCNNVSYTGTRLKTGASIKLTGRTVYRIVQIKLLPANFSAMSF